MTNKNDPAKHVKDIANAITPNFAEHVVGIGCSAGSLTALKNFFLSLPEDTSAAYIVVQHLSPDFKSLMDEILLKYCKLPIVMAKDLDIIEKNKVYIMASRQYLSLADGRVLLSDIIEPQKNHPIDCFFKSLAEEFQNRSIGVILSGTGEDGRNGIIELKRVGALCIAQDPKDAEFDGMPCSAIATGFCQYIVAANMMGPIIQQYLEDDSHFLNTTKNNDFTQYIEQIFSLIKEESNIDFSEYKVSTATRRIHHRMGVMEISSIEHYLEYLQRENNELQLLAQDMLINVTQFFRDHETWEFLTENVIKPLLLEKSAKESIRIWVPGCASGEEAYTLAILIEEAQKALNLVRKVSIFATDIDRRSTRKGGEGIFDIHAKSEIPTHLLSSYFTETSEHLIVKPLIREKIVFTTHNLSLDPPFSNMDLISCRNLLIYFQPSIQKRILSYFHFALNTEGYLLLGSAESIGGLSNYYKIINNKNRLYKKDATHRISLAEAGMKNNFLDRTKHDFSTMIPKKVLVNSQLQQVMTKIKESLIECYAPPTLVLDPRHQLIYSFGDTHTFTKKISAGMSSLHYSTVLHEEIAPFVTTALKRYQQSNSQVIIRNITFPAEALKFDLTVIFISDNSDSEDGYFLVSLQIIAELSPQESAEERNFRRQSIMGQQIQHLDAALLDATELINEKQQDLDALTEELQCSNEELMAANEELQSSNEELQSVNEELYTVNSEYQEKIKELEAANYDLDNLLNSTQLGVIYLDEHLLIRRFTPKARDFVKLLPLDLNRPFSDLSLNFTSEHIYEWLNSAKNSLKAKTYRIKNVEKQDIELSINPYIDKHNNLEGLILVFKET